MVWLTWYLPLCSHSCKSCCFLLIYPWFISSDFIPRCILEWVPHWWTIINWSCSAISLPPEGSDRGYSYFQRFVLGSKEAWFLRSMILNVSFQFYGFANNALPVVCYFTIILYGKLWGLWGENSHISADLWISIWSIRVDHQKSIIQMKWSLWSLDRVWISF